MTTYYYGIIEFGQFVKDGDEHPVAIIHTVKDVKEFDTPEKAWDYYVANGKEFESYVSTESVDEHQRRYELVFKGR